MLIEPPTVGPRQTVAIAGDNPHGVRGDLDGEPIPGFTAEVTSTVVRRTREIPVPIPCALGQRPARPSGDNEFPQKCGRLPLPVPIPLRSGTRGQCSLPCCSRQRENWGCQNIPS